MQIPSSPSTLHIKLPAFTIRRKILFLTTDPLTDVRWLLLLLPFWWFLGVEQFIGSIILTWSAYKTLLIKDFRVRISPVVLLMLAFVVVHLISGLFIVENFRIITFLRNFSTYVTALWLLFIITNQVTTWRQVERILSALVIMISMAAVVGALSIAGFWPSSFQSVIGYLMPGWIKSSSYGSVIAYRSTGQLSWFVGLGQYFRVTSLFLFATLYASALAFMLPVILFMLRYARSNLLRVGLVIIFGLSCLNLVFTTGRIAVVGFICGFAFFILIRTQRGSGQFFPVLIATCALVGLLGGLGVWLVAPGAPAAAYEAFILARGPGSFNDRTFVYQRTIVGALERPFFGWGTERSIPGSPYPAGSHSYYLGILYKQGLIGFGIFLGIWATLWWYTRPLRRMADDPTTRKMLLFLYYSRWVLVAALVNSATDVLDLDATTLTIIWTIFALALATRSLLKQQPPATASPSV